MEDNINPYVASNVSPTYKRRSQKNTVILNVLRIYCIHYVCGIAGLLAGAIRDSSILIWVFPFHKSWIQGCVGLLAIPVSDIYLIIEPFTEEAHPDLSLMLITRSVLNTTVVMGLIAYTYHHRIWLIWYVGVVTFAIYSSITFHGIAGKFN